jgi:hypothetical protein
MVAFRGRHLFQGLCARFAQGKRLAVLGSREYARRGERVRIPGRDGCAHRLACCVARMSPVVYFGLDLGLPRWCDCSRVMPLVPWLCVPLLCGVVQDKDTLERYCASKLTMHGKCIAATGLHRPLNSTLLPYSERCQIRICGTTGLAGAAAL